MSNLADYSVSILESLGEGILALDQNRRVVMINAYLLKLLSLKKEDIMGQIPELIFAERSDLLRVIDVGFSQGELVTDVHLVHHMADGGLQYLRVDTSFLNAQIQTGLVLAVRDVSEVKRSEWEMGQIEKMTALGRLAASVAHEVRNPLGAIDIQLQLLGEDLDAVPDALRQKLIRRLTIAQTEMKRMDRIVHNFLRFSRTPQLHLENLILNDVVGHVFELVSPEARERNIKLLLELAHDVPAIDGDEDQLAQAVLNMTVNAFQSMVGGGQFVARTWVDLEANQVCLALSDTGCGISDTEIDRIFEFYYTTKDEGTGLGLSIVQRIIYQHGGHLDVDSRVGEGTTFYIYLPVSGKQKDVDNKGGL
ncbi:MAG: PAS domain S-box-containing protein [Candidatus Latescibacterota bacterium]|jgi:PAS domain S-box-containing protein